MPEQEDKKTWQRSFRRISTTEVRWTCSETAGFQSVPLVMDRRDKFMKTFRIILLCLLTALIIAEAGHGIQLFNSDCKRLIQIEKDRLL